MKKVPLAILSTIFAIQLFGQVRISKLVIKSKEVFQFGATDILVADTLILMDSAKMILNKLKRENYIRAQVAIFGNGSIIDGAGAPGKNGRKGRKGETSYSPCKNGVTGKIGAKGLDGGPGVNLYLYFENTIINGKLSINLSGGNGGNGGDGGTGGGGGPGTVHCSGGNGGDGGNAGQGGNGGTLLFNCKQCPNAASLVKKSVRIFLDGGSFGYGGFGGENGPAGLGVTRKSRNGVSGKVGLDAEAGKSGNVGSLKFEEN